MKSMKLSLIVFIGVILAAFLSGCVSAGSVGRSPEKEAISADRPWAVIPPAAYHKIFPDAAAAERENEVRVNVNYRDKLEEYTLGPGKQIDNILTKISSKEKVPVTTFAWIALVKISVEYGPIAVISSVQEYLDSPKAMDGILIENGDGVVLLHESEFEYVAKCLARMFAARKTITPPEEPRENY